jgi:hypothetical protein
MKKAYTIFASFLLCYGFAIDKMDNNLVINGNKVILIFLFILGLLTFKDYQFKKRELPIINIIFLVLLDYFTIFKLIFFKNSINIIVLSLFKVLSLVFLSFLIYLILRDVFSNFKKHTLLVMKSKRKYIICLILSIILSLFEVFGKLEISNYTFHQILNYQNIISIIFWIIFLYYFFITLFNYLDSLKTSYLKSNNIKNLFLILFSVFMLVNIIYYLCYYPGIYTVDSINVLNQALGYTNITTHHSVLYTLLIKLFTLISSNIHLDMVIFCIFQIIMVSITFSYLFTYLIKRKVNKYLIIFFLIYFITSPIMGMYSFAVWKDIPFSLSIVWFSIFLIEMTNKKKFNITLFIIISLAVMLFRNNGLYMYLLTMPFIILFNKEEYKKILLSLIIIFSVYFTFTGPIYKLLNVEKSSAVDALSIPVQQIARTFRDYSNQITMQEYLKVNEYLDASNIGILYNPLLSDPIKNTFKNNFYQKNKKDFYKIWFSLLKKYPESYIDAFLSEGLGYYYPEAQHWTIASGSEINYDLYRKEFKFESNPIIKTNVSTATIANRLRNVPILSMFYSIGFSFWLLFASLFYTLYKKQYKFLTIYILFVWLFTTLLASPVFCEYRYAYPLIISLPIVLTVSLYNKKNQ